LVRKRTLQLLFVLIPDSSLGRKPIVGASLLAKSFKSFASKPAPTEREFSNALFGLIRSPTAINLLFAASKFMPDSSEPAPE
jgi:hypothetical protein